jgi:hypothetical protein
VNTQNLLWQIHTLSGSSASEYLPLLQALASYYQQTVPSAIEDRIVLETESVLNRLYETAQLEFTDPEIQELILEALSKSGSLSYNIKRGSSINPEYFRTIKILGRTIGIIANHLE